jgi:hypothetical protein
MSTRQKARKPSSEIEVDFTDRTGPVLTEAQYAEAMWRIGGVALELRRIARSIDWEPREPSAPAPRQTLH